MNRVFSINIYSRRAPIANHSASRRTTLISRYFDRRKLRQADNLSVVSDIWSSHGMVRHRTTGACVMRIVNIGPFLIALISLTMRDALLLSALLDVAETVRWCYIRSAQKNRAASDCLPAKEKMLLCSGSIQGQRHSFNLKAQVSAGVHREARVPIRTKYRRASLQGARQCSHSLASDRYTILSHY